MATAKVRIAVCVDANGNWECCGDGEAMEAPGHDDGHFVRIMEDFSSDDVPIAAYIVTAELQIPTARVIPGLQEPFMVNDDGQFVSMRRARE